MMELFIFIAGSLATGAAILLLLPLIRRRADALPPAAIAGVVALAVVLLGGAGLYAAWSKYTWTEGLAADSPAAMTARLARRLAREPNDLEGWLLLGRSYGELQQFPLAVRAYQRADRLSDGTNAQAVLGMAEALATQNPDLLGTTAGKLFERALTLEPANPKVLFYAAFAAMARGDAVAARDRFSKLLALNPPPQIRSVIETRIAELDAQLEGGVASVEPATANSPALVAVHITLAPALASKVNPEAPLFVAARDPKAPGPPFAAKRLTARFPLDVELTPADAMLPSRKIAAGQKLEVIARIALGGTATATSGDPFGQVSYHVGKDGRLNIVIDRLSP